jgi:sulfatase maturation enzyme AslB (radical SAM superfamily)
MHMAAQVKGRAIKKQERKIMIQINPLEKPDSAKFQDPDVTADGETRASVSLKKLETLWFNTGTLCNLECVHCYIESSPRNERLVYISAEDVRTYLDEIERDGLGTREIGFTGGEPFMNPEIIQMLQDCLSREFETLVLTNGMRPKMNLSEELLTLKARFGDRLRVRVSIDHYGPDLHEEERGKRSWEPAIEGLRWLSKQGFCVSVAGRSCWGEEEVSMRAGYARLFEELEISINAYDPVRMVIFPEMDETIDVPEITTQCWNILGMSPEDVMCASSRMVVKRKGAERPAVVSCTLLPYDLQFEMGETLAEAACKVKLNHPHCARFCVLGGASCSATKE